MTERAAPMYCPYCGEDTIRPWGDEPDDAPAGRSRADWRCESCLRVFVVRYKGLTGTG
jgi:transposase-like protein